MPMLKFLLSFACYATASAIAQDLPVPAEIQAPPVATQVEIPDDGIRVAVLGYHEFGEKQVETAMRIKPTKFRAQMESIRQLGLSVITLEQFTAWKNEGQTIPAKSVLLTFDDGWKSVYTDAYPVLKEFGFPFTLFLYKNYVDGGGKALTTPMIQEMIAGGASIGSHSVTHPYPVTVKSYRKKGPEAFNAYLRKEMGESKRFLETKFPVKVLTYAYPGGFFTPEMEVVGSEFGYRHLFTVLPGKIKRSLPNAALPRYIILGNYDKIFELATSFRETGESAPAGGVAVVQETPFPVLPEPGAIINSRLPEISADLAKVENLDPATLVMKVSGFGEVPANFASESKKFSWQVNRRLRQPSCQVSVTWKDPAGKIVTPSLQWSFRIDRESAYLPDGE